jgi:hypothetical protein
MHFSLHQFFRFRENNSFLLARFVLKGVKSPDFFFFLHGQGPIIQIVCRMTSPAGNVQTKDSGIERKNLKPIAYFS